MIISDLNHLEVVSEVSSILGGIDVDLDVEQDQNRKLDIKKGNVTLISQIGVGVAVAVNRKGKAVAKADVKNKTN